MILPKEILALIFCHCREIKTLYVLRGLNRYYNQLYRNEVLCGKLNKLINIECKSNPGLNFSTRMKQQLKRNQDKEFLYLCLISYNIRNLKIDIDSCSFNPVQYIQFIDETTLKSERKISTNHGKYSINRIEWHKDGRLGFYNQESDDTTFKINVTIPRIRAIKYGIRCIAIILIEGKYTIVHCVIDPITTIILEIDELKTGLYLKEWSKSKCTIL